MKVSLNIISLQCFILLMSLLSVVWAEKQWTRQLQTKWSNRTVYEFKNVEYGVYFSDKRKFLPSFDKSSFENSINGNLERDNSSGLLQPLHVTVYTPNMRGKKPVMVHIGDYDLLYATADSASPGFLLEKDIVLVSVEYRTGAKGFLSMRNEQIPGNAGVFDILLALKWVQKNIEQYGGDPDRVTLFGQYKVAGVIHVLTLSDLAKDLFHQVILQSGSALLKNFTSSNPIPISREVGSALKCKDVHSKIKLTKCLVEANDVDLSAAYSKVWDMHKGNIPFITIGGPSNLLTESPEQIHRSGQFRIYPKIIGFVDQPSAYFLDFFDPTPEKSSFFTLDRFAKDATSFVKLAGEIFGESNWERLMPNASSLAQLENADPKTLRHTFNLVLTSILDWSSLYVKSAIYYTGFLNKTPKTFAYTFKYNGKHHTLPLRRSNLLNVAMLLDDDRFLFDSYADELNEGDTKIAKLMVDFWASFAATGKPHSEGVVDWPEVKVGKDEYLIIDDEVGAERDFTNELQSATKTYLDESDNKILREYGAKVRVE